MTSAIQHMVRAADAAIARAYLKLFRERNAILSFLFHSLFRDEQEIAQNLIDPLEHITVAKFRQFIEYYLNNGYQFIGPPDLLKDLPSDKKYALITFDDGYFNNTLARPILEEYRAPATFFIATNNVLQNKCYWWDVLYRERIAQGASPEQIKEEGLAVKNLRTEEIERQLIERFGPDAMRPRGDIDRPFTPRELREFASCPYVHLGNHTANHGILTNYTPEQVIEQVRGAQEALSDMVGVQASAIAYPNGAHSEGILDSCRNLGLKIGFTVKPAKIPLPLDSEPQSLLRLSRFCLNGDDAFLAQCRTCRSDLQLYGKFRETYLRLRRCRTTQ